MQSFYSQKITGLFPWLGGHWGVDKQVGWDRPTFPWNSSASGLSVLTRSRVLQPAITDRCFILLQLATLRRLQRPPRTIPSPASKLLFRGRRGRTAHAEGTGVLSLPVSWLPKSGRVDRGGESGHRLSGRRPPHLPRQPRLQQLRDPGRAGRQVSAGIPVNE